MNKANIEKCNGNEDVYKMDKSSITNCMGCLYQPMCKESEKFTRDHEYSKVIGKLVDPETYVMSICDKFEDKSKYIKLPCKVGDTVYINAWFGKAVPHVVKKIGSVYIQTDDFGKSVFLTREEAEKALKEVKEND